MAKPYYARTKLSKKANQLNYIKALFLSLLMEEIIQEEGLGEVINMVRELTARVNEKIRFVSFNKE